MNRSIVRYAPVVLFALAAVAWPRAGYAQQMNFSFYADAGVSSDDQSLFMAIDGYDNSTGCTHYDYQTYGQVSGPTGSYDQYVSGLQSWIQVPAAEGNYSYSSNLTLNCSCFGSGLGAGGGFGTLAISLPHYPDPVKLRECQLVCDEGQAEIEEFCRQLPPFPPPMRIVRAVCWASVFSAPVCKGFCYAVWGDW
jgi:hypothetical protein